MPGFETLQHREVGAHRLELAVHPARSLEHDAAELGGLRAAPAANEQRHAELRLELADLVGHVRLHGVQRVGRGRERAFLGDREQGLELAQLHVVLAPFRRPHGAIG